MLLATGICALVEAQVVASLWHHGHFLRALIYTWLVSLLFALFSRVVICVFTIYVRPYLRQSRNAVIVGGGAHAPAHQPRAEFTCRMEIQILGVVDSVTGRDWPVAALPLLGRIGDLEEILMRQVVDEVIVASPVKSHYAAIERIIASMRTCRGSGAVP